MYMFLQVNQNCVCVCAHVHMSTHAEISGNRGLCVSYLAADPSSSSSTQQHRQKKSEGGEFLYVRVKFLTLTLKIPGKYNFKVLYIIISLHCPPFFYYNMKQFPMLRWKTIAFCHVFFFIIYLARTYNNHKLDTRFKRSTSHCFSYILRPSGDTSISFL